jgi:hypothetical protein
MIFPREIQALHQQIIEYMNYAKFENTSECFEHEIKTKIVTKQLLDRKINLMDDETPELFRMMKGVKKASKRDRRRQDEYKKLQEEYLDLLAGSRQIFKLGLKLIDICEGSEEVYLNI